MERKEPQQAERRPELNIWPEVLQDRGRDNESLAGSSSPQCHSLVRQPFDLFESQLPVVSDLLSNFLTG